MDDRNMSVDLRSHGFQHHPIVRANCILAHRAITDKKMSYGDVTAQIELHLRDLLLGPEKASPSPRMIRNWARDYPNYPEWAVSNGIVKKGDLLVWAREHLSSEAPPSSGSIGTPLSRGGYSIKGVQRHRQTSSSGAKTSFSPQKSNASLSRGLPISVLALSALVIVVLVMHQNSEKLGPPI
jgi:hypothetical protein